MGLFDKVKNDFFERQNSLKAEMNERSSQRQEKSSMMQKKSINRKDTIELDYPVIVSREDGTFYAFTYGEFDLEAEDDNLETCLEDIKEEVESVLQEYVDENYEMPPVPTIQELQEEDEVQQYLSEGMKIKIVKVKLDVSSLQEEDDSWGEDDEDTDDGDDW